MNASIDVKTHSQWSTGAVMEIFVTNNGDSPIEDYRLGFDLPGTITDIWSASIASHDADRYLIGETGSDSTIAPGDTVRFKFKVASDAPQRPDGFTLNGHALTATDDDAVARPEPVEEPTSEDDGGLFSDIGDLIDAIGDLISGGGDTLADDITVDADITAAQLQALIDQAPEGATIHLGAGTYRFDDSITVSRSDITLAGAGSDATRIVFTDEALDNDADTGILVAGGNTRFAGQLESDAVEGSRTLDLAADHGLTVGDTVRLWQDNTAEYFAEIGDDSWQKYNAPLRTSMAKVVAVDGDQVTLDRGVHFTFAGGEARIEKVDALDKVSLSGFSIGYELGEPDPGKFANTLSDFKDYQAVRFDATTDARLDDIQVINGPGTAFEFARSLDLEAEALGAHGSFNKGSGGIGYAYELREMYDGTLTHLEDSGMRHSVLFASWRSSVGNDVHVSSTDRDINFHGGQDHHNTVHVERSIRTEANDGMSTSLWTNSGGESFGAITDMSTNRVTFDYLIGSRRDDVIHGSDDGVYLDGGLGDDRLHGGAGDDILRGGDGWGDNLLDGGAGFDIALFGEVLATYTLERNAAGHWRVDGAGTDDTLIDMEAAYFADGKVLDLRTGEVRQGEAFVTPSPEAILGDGDAQPAPMPVHDEQPGPDATPDVPVEPPLDAPAPDDTTEIPAPPADGDDAGALGYELTPVHRWSTGYVMRVTVTNHGDEDLVDPTIAFDLDTDLDQLYNASLVSADDGRYTVAYEGATTVMAPGESITFSFKAYAAESLLPEALTLNGRSATLETEGLFATDANPGDALDADAVTSITTHIKSEWSSGYVGEVFVENTSAATLDDVTLAFDLPSGLSSLWNAEIVADDAAGHYVIGDDQPLSLAPGETWRFAYKTYDADKTPLANLDVEGEVSSGGASGPVVHTGGDGADTFVFRTLQAAGPEAPARIEGFSLDEGDVIDLSGIDADLTRDGDQAFVWRDEAGFTGRAGELRLDEGTLHGDVNGDGVADLAIELGGVAALDAQGLLL
ncbi:cellulose binding domain-containing protein [Modicisalibacter coralii]|uniref:cellulose binding domain-containing protein n=1 Tax=Modicisalibacter coralii TaxID=2304602 RepID=UPI00100A697A|nr:cellulose binding domain-containing protein [Halomonas coralii]